MYFLKMFPISVDRCPRRSIKSRYFFGQFHSRLVSKVEDFFAEKATFIHPKYA